MPVCRQQSQIVINAVTGEVNLIENHMSDNATYHPLGHNSFVVRLSIAQPVGLSDLNPLTFPWGLSCSTAYNVAGGDSY